MHVEVLLLWLSWEKVMTAVFNYVVVFFPDDTVHCSESKTTWTLIQTETVAAMEYSKGTARIYEKQVNE